MQQKSITVKYPALLKWLKTLNVWYDVAKKSSTKDASFHIWNNDQQAAENWIESGHGIMLMGQCYLNVAEELMGWIENGVIDPERVATQLDFQDWDYVVQEDYADNQKLDYYEYYPLKESWDAAVGFAMVLTKKEITFCNKSRAWLAQGMDLFYVPQEVEDYTASELIDSSHEAWLRELCSRAPWVCEVVAAWVLENGINSPMWEWCFHEHLGKEPSVNFIETVCFQIEQALEGSANAQVELLQMKAPIFFNALETIRGVYTALYGCAPQEHLAQQTYCKNRAATIQSMLTQTTVPYIENVGGLGVSLSSPSMGKLFEDDAPSNAV